LLIIEGLHAAEFAADQVELLGFGFNLRVKTADLFAELRDAALKDVDLASTSLAAPPEPRLLSRKHRPPGAFARPAGQFRGYCNLVQAVAFGRQPGNPGASLV